VSDLPKPIVLWPPTCCLPCHLGGRQIEASTAKGRVSAGSASVRRDAQGPQQLVRFDCAAMAPRPACYDVFCRSPQPTGCDVQLAVVWGLDTEQLRARRRSPTVGAFSPICPGMTLSRAEVSRRPAKRFRSLPAAAVVHCCHTSQPCCVVIALASRLAAIAADTIRQRCRLLRPRVLEPGVWTVINSRHKRAGRLRSALGRGQDELLKVSDVSLFPSMHTVLHSFPFTPSVRPNR